MLFSVMKVGQEMSNAVSTSKQIDSEHLESK